MDNVSIPQNMNHTPSPWGFGNGRDGERLILGQNGSRNYVCNVQIHQTPRHMGILDEEEREANAQLIKAAPDMLEALKQTTDQIEADNDSSGLDGRGALVGKARAAIAKAEGKGE